MRTHDERGIARTTARPLAAASTFVRELRAFSFPLSALPVLLAVAAVRPVRQWHFGLLAAEIAGVLLLHALGNVLNDYFDFVSGADRPLPDDAMRPGRLLVRGAVTLQQVRAEALVLFMLFLAPAAYILVHAGAGIWVFAGIGLAGAWAYTGPPFRLKARALGELTVFVVFGPALMLGAAYVQTGRVEPAALALSIPVGACAAAVLAGNNLRDRTEDADGGLRTLAHVWGARMQLRFYLGLLMAAVFGIAGIGIFRGGRLLALIAAPAAILPLLPTVAALSARRRVPDLDARTAQAAAMLYTMALVVLIWSGGFPAGA